MKKRAIPAMFFLLVSFLAAGSNAFAREEEKITPIEGFPNATITIFPVTMTITGPINKHREFYDAAKKMIPEEAKKNATSLGLLLEEKGYDKYTSTDTEFWFPEEKAARNDRAAIFGSFVGEMDLKTDYALCTEFVCHLEQSFQEVYSVIVNAKGEVVWEDSQRAGDPEFDEDFPGTPQKCIALACRRLTPGMGLNELPKKELAEDKKKILRELRWKEPPHQSEIAAMKERLKIMKKVGTSATVRVYSTRVDGDYVFSGETTHLTELINESGLIQAAETEEDAALEGHGWPNEMDVLWIFSKAAKAYVQQHPVDSDYVLLADYWRTPRGEVWAVHFVVLDRAGEWVVVDLQNNHKSDFQHINPQTLEDCNRLVMKRLESCLR